MKKRYYLAYGSNLHRQQMLWRCPDAELVGTATIPDYRLMFKGSKTGAYLTIEPAKGHSVRVGVWAVSRQDEHCLDRYEGYPTFYYKKDMTVDVTEYATGENHPAEAFVYIMHEERPLGMPSRAYTHTCCIGYAQFDFDIAVLNEAMNYTRMGERYERRTHSSTKKMPQLRTALRRGPCLEPKGQ